MDRNAAWTQVEREAARLEGATLRTLFAEDGGRFERLRFALDDLTLDLSKEKLDAAALDALLTLARACGVEARRDAMARGEPVNAAEGRPALHMALRGGVAPPVEGVSEVAETLDRFLAFAEAVRSGAFAPPEGPFTDVVNIGIGGSDLGPAMATRALAPDHDGPRARFVSNVDGAHLADALRGLDPRRTLLIVASKTFTTLETMTNARTAKAWLAAAVGEDAAAERIAAVSTNLPACAEFGVPAERVFGFWDWVGGRYSLWSAIGLPLAVAIGATRFREMLEGAAAMDRHFLSAPLEENLPALYAMAGVWRRDAMGWPSVALIPYDQRLERFPAYVQQLDMESNGKRTTLAGEPVSRPTGPLVWGEPGTNAQHSFFQLLHQGTDVIPVDFILSAEPRAAAPLDEAAARAHHVALVANCLAQSAALAFGRTEAEARVEGAEGALAAHKTFPGDRPSTTILHRRLDARSLGRLIALFEHKVFVQAAIWGINPFDQWGVELGKALAKQLTPAVEQGRSEGHDASTAGLLARLAELRG